MFRAFRVASVVGCCGFGALVPHAAQALDISVNFANAETSFGFVNTSLNSLGSLYYQQRGSSSMSYIMDIDSPEARRSKSVAAEAIESSAPKGLSLSFGFTGLEVLSKAEIQAEAKRTARIFVRKVTTEQYAAPLSLLNAPALSGDRALFASFCPSDNCRFVFVYHVTKVDEGGFGFGRAVTAGGKLTFPALAKIQGFEAKVGYDNSQALNWAGVGSPMFYRPMYVSLVKKGDDYLFVPDMPKRAVARRR